MNDLERAIRHLAQSRQVQAEYKHQVAEINAEINAEIREKYGAILERAQSLLMIATADVQDNDEYARRLVLEGYEATGAKRPHPAAQIKLFTVLDYDYEAAVEFCQAAYPQGIKLDKRTFEKAARALSLPFVTVTKEPRASIARDLSEYVGEGASE